MNRSQRPGPAGWDWKAEARKWIDSRPRRLLLVLASYAAVPLGLYYYKEQLAISPAWHWPLIPDSPIAAGIYGTAVLLHHLGRASRIVDLVGSVLMIKIGSWTVFVLLFHLDAYFTPDTLVLRTAILFTHALMVPMGFIPLSDGRTHFSLSTNARAFIFFMMLKWLLILDVVDYLFDTHPWVPARGIQVVAAAAFTASVGSTALVWLATRRPRATSSS